MAFRILIFPALPDYLKSNAPSKKYPDREVGSVSTLRLPGLFVSHREGPQGRFDFCSGKPLRQFAARKGFTKPSLTVFEKSQTKSRKCIVGCFCVVVFVLFSPSRLSMVHVLLLCCCVLCFFVPDPYQVC